MLKLADEPCSCARIHASPKAGQGAGRGPGGPPHFFLELLEEEVQYVGLGLLRRFDPEPRESAKPCRSHSTTTIFPRIVG